MRGRLRPFPGEAGNRPGVHAGLPSSQMYLGLCQPRLRGRLRGSCWLGPNGQEPRERG